MQQRNLTVRSSLDAAFYNAGRQVIPVMARLNGRVQELETLLNLGGWQMTIDGLSGLYELSAEKPEETITKGQ
ncbi:hypothetical protein [Pantoea agglomerans]|uniref:hypothetical protein n=1 Tax=Enterobacter agglomerans TaxID=549 RepID=UPI00157FEC45|nr:hypothetical protein [Pantoea agglomerans]